jgi:hypothetical protein
LSGAEPSILYNEIGNNSGGIYAANSDPVIKSNWIYGNSYWGITTNDSSGAIEVRNNTIIGHTDNGISRYSATVAPIVTNCILWDNNDDLYDVNATYSCIEDGDAGAGNISSYPYF